MRDRTRFALKQAVSIFLLIGTLACRVIPTGFIDKPRAFLMDGVCRVSSPLYFLSGAVLSVPAAAVSWGQPREDLERQVQLLRADLAAKDSQLQRARQELESIKSYQGSPLSKSFSALGGGLQGSIRGGDTSVFSRSYVVNLGTRQGVQKGAPVIWGKYAIGVISEVGESYSRVRVLGDPESRLTVRFLRSRWPGVLVGRGRQTAPVRFVPNRVEEGEIKVGDLVLTSGVDRLFPPDLLVGRVSKFYKRESEPSADVEVELLVDFDRIETCMVLKYKPEIPGE